MRPLRKNLNSPQESRSSSSSSHHSRQRHAAAAKEEATKKSVTKSEVSSLSLFLSFNYSKSILSFSPHATTICTIGAVVAPKTEVAGPHRPLRRRRAIEKRLAPNHRPAASRRRARTAGTRAKSGNIESDRIGTKRRTRTTTTTTLDARRAAAGAIIIDRIARETRKSRRPGKY